MFHSVLFYCAGTDLPNLVSQIIAVLPQVFTLLICGLIGGSIFQRLCFGPLH